METTLSNLENQDHNVLYETREPDGFVYSEYTAYCETGQLPYIESVAKHIAAKLPPLSDRQSENLRTHVYYSSCKRRREKEAHRKNELLSEGWNEANTNALTDVFAKGTRRIELLYVQESLLGGEREKAEYFKLVSNGNRVFVMKPKARTKGIPVDRLYNGYPMFYKEVTA